MLMLPSRQDGTRWLAELQRIRAHDATFGHWAHALLGLARKLHAAGTLSVSTPQPPRWRGSRLAPGEANMPLGSCHTNWLVEQASLLADLSDDVGDPVGQTAGFFVDWLIWFWTADACHPRTLTVRRDAIKHDPRHLYSTASARRDISDATARGVRASGVVEHEHAVPKRIVVGLILNRTLSPRDALVRFAKAVIVSKQEHRLLNLHYRESMPPGWNPTNAAADPLARYRDPKITITIDPPC
ncbi:hypothetical protein WME94_34435 [Sorangium sp. So ce429]